MKTQIELLMCDNQILRQRFDEHIDNYKRNSVFLNVKLEQILLNTKPIAKDTMD